IQWGDKRIAGGTVFEVSEAEYKELQQYVEKVGYVSDVFPPIRKDEDKPKTSKPRTKKKG
ncbi:MAG: hypothetical protein IKH49_05450, partial [Bacteroidales bacterium]|nr:hypothetical protein [Bacteroidales bacterium]